MSPQSKIQNPKSKVQTYAIGLDVGGTKIAGGVVALDSGDVLLRRDMPTRPERIVEGAPMRVEAEDNAHVLIEFPNAVLGVVTTGFTMQRYRSPAIEIYGSEGTIQMLGDDWDPDGYELWRNSVGAWQIFAETDPNWPWTDGLRHLVECIQSGARPMITPEHSFHALEIMIKAQESGRDGQARPIESTFAPPTFFQEGEQTAPHLVHDRTNL